MGLGFVVRGGKVMMRVKWEVESGILNNETFRHSQLDADDVVLT